MTRNTQPDSWLDSYEDQDNERHKNTANSPTTAGSLTPLLVNTAEAARLLGGINPKTLQKWRDNGHLDGAWFRIDGPILYCVDALKEAVRRLCEASALTARSDPSH
ncbi:hypothetical protein HNQ40_000660 [Algisphaera agarilytica]|uniref:Helix-turn-helix domain-containing protein n=1 Tax=Algisphaera agarilytica TaxID=1385975 RepID=A0A7X0H445_9BACT|nr:hypothetical protein [Algisphaera agarilytica]